MHTPLAIEILLHYYTSPLPHPNSHTSAASKEIYALVADGILGQDQTAQSEFRVTEKGRAWLQMIRETPYPEQAWINPGNNSVIEVK